MNALPIEPPAGMDLLTEVWGLHLLHALGLDREELLFRSQGQHGRSQRKDILAVERKATLDDTAEQYVVDLRRDGLYDLLPEALFHEAGSSRSTKRNAVEDRNEQQARDFFLPFEQELFRLRMGLRADGDAQAAHAWNNAGTQALAALWMLPAGLGDRTRKALLEVLPYARQVQGDLDATAACFAFVLGHPVRIQRLPPAPAPVPAGRQVVLGEAPLGSGAAMGDVFYDGWPSILVKIHDLPVLKVDDPRERQAMLTLAKILADHFLPAHLDVRFELDVRADDQALVLGNEHTPALLAFNTCI